MYTGATAKLKFGATTKTEVAYISNWSIETTNDLIEIECLSFGAKKIKEIIPTKCNSWTASADGAVDFATTTGQEGLFNCMKNGEKIKFYFYLLEDAVSNYTTPPTQLSHIGFEGEGYIESMSIDISAEDKGNISISVKGVGELKMLAKENVTQP